MARKPRIEFEGAIYHITNRGEGGAGLFATPEAAQVFVDCLYEATERMHWRLHAYCLTPDSYHLALETPLGNLTNGSTGSRARSATASTASAAARASTGATGPC